MSTGKRGPQEVEELSTEEKDTLIIPDGWEEGFPDWTIKENVVFKLGYTKYGAGCGVIEVTKKVYSEETTEPFGTQLFRVDVNDNHAELMGLATAKSCDEVAYDILRCAKVYEAYVEARTNDIKNLRGEHEYK